MNENEKTTFSTDTGPYLGYNDQKFYLEKGCNLIGSVKQRNNNYNLPWIIIDDTNLDTKHAAINYLDDCFKIIDLGSSTGTFINGINISPLKWKYLNSTTHLSFGNLEVTFNKNQRLNDDSGLCNNHNCSSTKDISLQKNLFIQKPPAEITIPCSQRVESSRPKENLFLSYNDEEHITIPETQQKFTIETSIQKKIQTNTTENVIEQNTKIPDKDVPDILTISPSNKENCVDDLEARQMNIPRLFNNSSETGLCESSKVLQTDDEFDLNLIETQICQPHKDRLDENDDWYLYFSSESESDLKLPTSSKTKTKLVSSDSKSDTEIYCTPEEDFGLPKISDLNDDSEKRFKKWFVESRHEIVNFSYDLDKEDSVNSSHELDAKQNLRPRRRTSVLKKQSFIKNKYLTTRSSSTSSTTSEDIGKIPKKSKKKSKINSIARISANKKSNLKKKERKSVITFAYGETENALITDETCSNAAKANPKTNDTNYFIFTGEEADLNQKNTEKAEQNKTYDDDDNLLVRTERFRPESPQSKDKNNNNVSMVQVQKNRLIKPEPSNKVGDKNNLEATHKIDRTESSSDVFESDDEYWLGETQTVKDEKSQIKKLLKEKTSVREKPLVSSESNHEVPTSSRTSLTFPLDKNKIYSSKKNSNYCAPEQDFVTPNTLNDAEKLFKTKIDRNLHEIHNFSDSSEDNSNNNHTAHELDNYNFFENEHFRSSSSSSSHSITLEEVGNSLKKLESKKKDTINSIAGEAGRSTKKSNLKKNETRSVLKIVDGEAEIVLITDIETAESEIIEISSGSDDDMETRELRVSKQTSLKKCEVQTNIIVKTERIEKSEIIEISSDSDDDMETSVLRVSKQTSLEKCEVQRNINVKTERIIEPTQLSNKNEIKTLKRTLDDSTTDRNECQSNAKKHKQFDTRMEI